MEMNASSGTEERLVEKRPVSSMIKEFLRPRFSRPKILEVKLIVEDVVDQPSLSLPDGFVIRNLSIIFALNCAA
jgi:hypothetical protein